MPLPTPPLACPACHTLLAPVRKTLAGQTAMCPQDGRMYTCQNGIWRCLLPERAGRYARFLQEYETVRLAEERGSPEPAYYQALPFTDLSGRSQADWEIRSHSFQALLQKFIQPLERHKTAPLNILDLGAGNGWLSNRLSERGHRLAAIDLRTGELDGLGAARCYRQRFTTVMAEFDRLPYRSGEFDAAIFNASLHYSTDMLITLGEALRVLAPHGRLAVVDTPLYSCSTSGEAMVREREAHFLELYGFASNSLPSENYLTPQRLKQLETRLGLHWRMIQPRFGLVWQLRPWRARLSGHREPARFPILVGSR